MSKYVMALCLLFSIQAFANEKAKLAEDAYALRDYNEAGVENVETAISLYQELIDGEGDAVLKATYQSKQASAYYFLGSALTKKDEQKAAYQNSMDVADKIMKGFGVDSAKAHELTDAQITTLKNNLTDEQEALLAEAMYSKGTSLAQWGNLNGIASSIGRLPEVLGLMDRIEDLGYEGIHEYGPYRTIGRVNFKLPSLFGGDLEKSEEFLKKATTNTLAEGQRYSINGYNNIYFAETLYKRGKENQAKALLKAFIDADFSTLAEGNEPENREALSVAKDMALDWGI